MSLYNNPLVTYDEIVSAIMDIIDCSINTSYLDDILSTKYESSIQNDNNEDKLLNDAIENLKESINSSSVIIRKSLENQIGDNDKKLSISCNYKLGKELRTSSWPSTIIDKIKNASLDIKELYTLPGEDLEYNKYEKVDTNKVYSDFERKAVLDFPNYFKEELSIANEDNEDEVLDVTDLFNTMELDNLLNDIKKINISTNPNSNIKKDPKLAEEVKIIKEENKKERKVDLVDSKLYTKLNLINKALKKAKKNGNTKIVSYLEKELARELNR